MSSDLIQRPVGTDDHEIEAMARLFATVWPQASHLNADYLRWLYRDNPAGHVIGVNAWADDVVGGHYVVVPILAEIGGEQVKAALSLNTAVHPGHQGKGLFTRLARATYEACEDRGIHHVIGVANANSTPGFLRKLDFRSLGPLDVKLCWRSPPPPGRSTATPASWRRSWSTESLDWRLGNPSASYDVHRLPARWHVEAPAGRPGVRAVLMRGRDDEPAQPPASQKRGRGMALKLWTGRGPRLRIPSAFGFDLPSRFKASPLNLIIRDVNGRADVDPATLEFQAMDFDAW